MLKVSFRRSLSMYKVVRTADIRGYWLVYVPKKNYFFRGLQQVATSRTTSYMLKKTTPLDCYLYCRYFRGSTVRTYVTTNMVKQ